MKILRLLRFLFVSFCVGYFLGHFGYVFLKGTPPITSSDFATWAGAIGTVGTVIVAGLAIYIQATSARDNVIRALQAELQIYQIALKDIRDKMWNDPASAFTQMLQMVFPSSSFRFPVYLANAAQIWAVNDRELRSKVIGLYADMDMLFSLLDRNSEVAMRIPTGQAPPPEIASELKQLHPLIEGMATNLLKNISEVIEGLKRQVPGD